MNIGPDPLLSGTTRNGAAASRGGTGPHVR